jgi:hypothetical protein
MARRTKLSPEAEAVSLELAESLALEPPPRKMSLVQIVDNIDLLNVIVESAKNDDEREAAQRELERCVVEELPTKVDGIGYYKKRIENQVAALRQGKRDITADFDRSIKRLEARWQRVRALSKYALTKANVPSFKGGVYTISLCSGEKTPDIFDPDLVPDKFKTVTVTMSAEMWERIRLLPVTVTLPDGREETTPVDDNVRSFHYVVDEAAVRVALEAKEEVPGAELRPGEDYVRVA